MADAPLDVPHAHRHIPSRTARSPELKDEIHMRATEVALNSLAKGAVLGVGVTLLLSRTWPWFGRRPRTFKTIFGLVFPIVGFVVGGEHTALRIERELAYQKSAVKLPGLVSENGMDAEMVEIRERPVTMESLKAYVLENQFKLLFSLWATLVSSTLIFTFANKTMPMAQKLIHARLVAQGGALTGFVGLAAFGIQGRKESEEDRLNRRIYEHVLDSHDGSGLEGVKAIETETPWQRAERWCARAKLDYEKCVSENPARGCIEKEDNLLQCLGGKVAGQTFKTWMTCHRSIRSVGSYEGRTDCEAYRALLKEAIELARDR